MFVRSLTAALLLIAVFVPTARAQDQAPPAVAPPELQRELSETEKLARQILTTSTLERNQVMAKLVDRGNTDVVPALIQSLRFMRQDPWTIANALQVLTGEEIGNSWHEWILWQEDHPEIKPFDGFAEYKAWAFSQIDPDFRLFLYDGIAHDIRLEEIVWGGVRKDGIPALVNPKLIPPLAANYLTPDELVFGVAINGDVRAYPLRILDWHEMFNDVVGGIPVALAYCTLCGSGILYETTVEGREKPFVFGSSGFLYRSNKLMYDRENKLVVEPVHWCAGGRRTHRVRHRAAHPAGSDYNLGPLAGQNTPTPRCCRWKPDITATTRPAAPMPNISTGPTPCFRCKCTIQGSPLNHTCMRCATRRWKKPGRCRCSRVVQ